MDQSSRSQLESSLATFTESYLRLKTTGWLTQVLKDIIPADPNFTIMMLGLALLVGWGRDSFAAG